MKVVGAMLQIFKKTGLMLHGAQSYDINVFATFSCSPLSSYGSYQKCHAAAEVPLSSDGEEEVHLKQLACRKICVCLRLIVLSR